MCMCTGIKGCNLSMDGIELLIMAWSFNNVRSVSISKIKTREIFWCTQQLGVTECGMVDRSKLKEAIQEIYTRMPYI
jgi:hypothetical protein